jgi:hypothetical protein
MDEHILKLSDDEVLVLGEAVGCLSMMLADSAESALRDHKLHLLAEIARKGLALLDAMEKPT